MPDPVTIDPDRSIASTIADRLEKADAEQAAEAIQELIANVVASLIDAGSERDAVMENEDLADALLEEFRGWFIPGQGWRPL